MLVVRSQTVANTYHFKLLPIIGQQTELARILGMDKFFLLRLIKFWTMVKHSSLRGDMTSFLTSSPIKIQSWPTTHDETQSCDKFSHWAKVSHPRPKRKPFKKRHDVTTEASSLRMTASLSFYSTFKCWCPKIYIISVSSVLSFMWSIFSCCLH